MALLAPEATEPVTWKVRNDIAAVARLRRKLERSRRVRSPAATSGPVRLRVAAAVDARPGWLRGDRAGAGATQAGRAACRRAWLATGPDLSQRRRDGATRPQPPRGLRLRSASIDAIDAGGMPSSLRSPPGPIRVSSGLPARSAVLSSTPARSGRRVQQLHPADTCGRRRRQVVSRASSHIRAVGFSGVQSGWVWARAGFEA